MSTAVLVSMQPLTGTMQTFYSYMLMHDCQACFPGHHYIVRPWSCDEGLAMKATQS